MAKNKETVLKSERRIPVIVISADAEALEKCARESGADEYFARAFKTRVLIRAV